LFSSKISSLYDFADRYSTNEGIAMIDDLVEGAMGLFFASECMENQVAFWRIF